MGKWQNRGFSTLCLKHLMMQFCGFCYDAIHIFREKHKSNAVMLFPNTSALIKISSLV